jgi:hypothetical protein
MPIAPISPIIPHPVFMQTHGLLDPARVANTFNATLTKTLNGLPDVRALQADTAKTQTAASLEQALFNQWLSNLQGSTGSALGSGLQTALASTLGMTRTSPPAFDPNNPQLLLLTARLIALFNTVDLLGGDTASALQPGSLLDTLA